MKNSSNSQASNAPLIDRDYTLQRFDGKGGWTYAEIPEIAPDPHAYFGWVRVKGSIDHYSLSNYRLQPMGNGRLFMPVNAKVRKLIGKEAGDVVHITLYRDELPAEVRDELLACLNDEPAALERFHQLPEATRNAHLDFIFDAKTEPIKIERIARVIDHLLSR